MGVIIGESTTGLYSTWAQLRCPLIGAYDQWAKYVGPGPQFHNLVINSGFHPDEGLFLRVFVWPQATFWLDINNNPHTAYTGPIVGYNDGFGTYPSFISVGSYDSTWNDSSNPFYTSYANNLDQRDIDVSLVGLTVTYSGGTVTTTSDAFENNPPYAPWYGQDIGLNAITSITGIDTFTAF